MKKTSWGNVANWYDDLLKGADTYQKNVVLPNLTKMMQVHKGEKILDMACGQGFFAKEFFKLGADVSGADISLELIKKAKENSDEKIDFFVSSSDKLLNLKDKSYDKITVILAIQNIANIEGTIKEAYRVLKNEGKLFIVLNHPAFRIPRKSSWAYDEKNMIQYRRVEKYLSEIMVKIDMNPGEKNPRYKKYTLSFHRPLQTYFSIFNKEGFLISGLEEWTSNKKSLNGPRKKAEDSARKEIPMFMCIEAIKNQKC